MYSRNLTKSDAARFQEYIIARGFLPEGRRISKKLHSKEALSRFARWEIQQDPCHKHPVLHRKIRFPIVAGGGL